MWFSAAHISPAEKEGGGEAFFTPLFLRGEGLFVVHYISVGARFPARICSSSEIIFFLSSFEIGNLMCRYRDGLVLFEQNTTSATTAVENLDVSSNEFLFPKKISS